MECQDAPEVSFVSVVIHLMKRPPEQSCEEGIGQTLKEAATSNPTQYPQVRWTIMETLFVI
jgi:hypothetical protein